MESLYSRRSNLIIGFHGCDESVVRKVVNGEEDLIPSTNDYDWLGNGIYFYEREIINYVKREQIMTDSFGHSNNFVSLSLQVLTYNSLYIINTRGRPRVNIRLFLQKCKRSLNVFCPCTNDFFQNLHL